MALQSELSVVTKAFSVLAADSHVRVKAAAELSPRAAVVLGVRLFLDERCAHNAQSWSFRGRILQLDAAAPSSCLMDEAEAFLGAGYVFSNAFGVAMDSAAP